MITDLWIENFKGIGKRQHIPLRPITLLFGRNSAGKSTILHALMYLREVLCSGNLNPTMPLAGDQTVNLGGFANLLHSGESSNEYSVKISIDVTLSSEQLRRAFPESSFDDGCHPLLLEREFTRFGLTVEIARSEHCAGLRLTPAPGCEAPTVVRTARSDRSADLRVIAAEVSIEGIEFIRLSMRDREFGSGMINLLHPHLGLGANSQERSHSEDRHDLDHDADDDTDDEYPGFPSAFGSNVGSRWRCVDSQYLSYQTRARAIDDAVRVNGLTAADYEVGTHFLVNRVLQQPTELKLILSGEIGSAAFNWEGLGLRSIRLPQYLANLGTVYRCDDGGYDSVIVLCDATDSPFCKLPVAVLCGDELARFGLLTIGHQDKGFLDRCVSVVRKAWASHAVYGEEPKWFDRMKCVFGGNAIPYGNASGGDWLGLTGRKRGSLDLLAKQLLNAVVDWSCSELRAITYVGPKRSSVPRVLSEDTADELASWGNGLAAWKWMLNASDSFLTKCVYWLSDPSALDSGYAVMRQLYKELPFYDATSITRDGLENTFYEQPIRMRLVVIERATGRMRHPQELGEGITQVVPVIVACVKAGLEHCMVAIEQPELHLHPCLAARLGDLFITTMFDTKGMDWRNSGRCLIETHSEHLILRILRRIRQTTDNELPEHIPPVKPDDVCVLWVDNLGDGTTVQRLRIDERGEFIDRWPKGFFSERAEELY